MLKTFKNLFLFSFLGLFLIGCSQKDYHNEMITNVKGSLNNGSYNEIKDSYSNSLVDEKAKGKEFISILSISYKEVFKIGKLLATFPQQYI